MLTFSSSFVLLKDAKCIVSGHPYRQEANDSAYCSSPLTGYFSHRSSEYAAIVMYFLGFNQSVHFMKHLLFFYFQQQFILINIQK